MPKAVSCHMVAVLFVALLSGCSAGTAFRSGQEYARQGDYDAAVAEFNKATAKRPESHEYRMHLEETRTKAAAEHLRRGRALAAAERFSEAADAFRMTLHFAPSLQIAESELKQIEQRQTVRQLIDEAEGFYQARLFAQARTNLRQALQISPNDQRALALLEQLKKEPVVVMDGIELDVVSGQPINLQFQNANIRDVFKILSTLSGINFIFDEDVRARQVSILLEDVSFPQALELLLKMNDLDKKILNGKNVIIFQKTKDKEKKYEDQVVQTFYLSNIDAKKVVNLLRTMLQLRKIYVHEELNAVIIRDTPAAIKLSQQIIESADRADSEVTYDLELIEVSRTDDLNFGPKLSSYSVQGGLGEITATGGINTINLTSGLSSLESFYSLPTAQFDFLKKKGNAEILANPRIRVKNKEKAKVHIGSREPVVTVTITGTDTRSDNVQYVDVGVKLDIEPNIQLDNTVVTKLSLEVSSVSGRQTTSSGTQVLTITTTNASTALTLKDGERTVIGGLMRDDLSKSRNSIAFLGDLPWVGNLFTSHANNKSKREILLSITPRVVRRVEMPRADVASIWSGGEDDLQAGPNFAAFAGTFEAVTEQLPPSPMPAATAGSRPTSLEVASARPESVGTSGEVAIAADAIAGLAAPGRVFFRGPQAVAVGEEFAVELIATEMANLFSAPVFVGYDGQRLELLRTEEGEFLRQKGQTTVFMSNADLEPNQVIVNSMQEVGGQGASGSGTLFRLVFAAKDTGRTALVLRRLVFRDPAGNLLPVEHSDLMVEVR